MAADSTGPDGSGALRPTDLVDLLRRALALPNHVYDANTDPSEAGWEPVDEERIGRALDERRSR